MFKLLERTKPRQCRRYVSQGKNSRKFAELRADDIPKRLSPKSILVQPLGAIEQHGPYLPLNTDSLIAEAVAIGAVEKVGEELDVWLLPTLQYTKSNEHAWSPGTMWLSPSTLLAVLEDLGKCVATTPAKRLVFFNGHGGNTALVNVALREIRLKHGLMTFQTHPGVPPDHGGKSAAGELGMGIHGGTDETSLMLHLAPHLVDMSKASRCIPEKLSSNSHVRFGGSVSFGWLSNDFSCEGHIGDPTTATKDLGKKIFEGAVKNFCDALHEVAVFNFGK
jgi:creatinine amidohydrolase